MRILVTGGAGFIGSNLVDELLRQGHFVRVLDNFCSGREENLEFSRNYSRQFELVRGDICDKDICLRVCESIEAISHQAALRSVPKSMSMPHEYNRVNIDGTLNLLEAAREQKVKRFVFASSSSVYGDVTTFPEKETFYPQLISPYALSKLAGEYYCRIFSEHFGIETICLRYFNVFGPRQALDDEYAVVIPKFIYCILHDQQPPIFGTGKQSRDFTYVDNVVEANILALTKINLPKKGSGVFHGVFNVANGKDTSVISLVGLINGYLKKSIEPQFLPPRPGDVFRTLADISSIKQVFGFVGKVSFEEGLQRTIEYWKKK
ncbi:MAG: SDR family oxidoreductase [Candidatus Omnitrophica bacterium]|nr:SDR family oxidoreductase [Candidatus Omnitrophota bacterium]